MKVAKGPTTNKHLNLILNLNLNLILTPKDCALSTASEEGRRENRRQNGRLCRKGGRRQREEEKEGERKAMVNREIDFIEKGKNPSGWVVRQSLLKYLEIEQGIMRSLDPLLL